jgi:hypothetical protein
VGEADVVDGAAGVVGFGVSAAGVGGVGVQVGVAGEGVVDSEEALDGAGGRV